MPGINMTNLSDIKAPVTFRYSLESPPRLMFITHRTKSYTEYDEARMALEGGCTWVQLRMKHDLNGAAACSLVRLCRDSYPEAVACIDDSVEIALESGAHAVHLGKNDLPVRQAWEMVCRRQQTRLPFFIGATANTFEDIRQAVAAGASYIGLGPYRFTETKKKLSPVLGIDGYRKIVEQCQKANLQIPIFAIGGILLDDVGPLMETGIAGIAVSGAIIQAPDPVAATREFLNQINKY